MPRQDRSKFDPLEPEKSFISRGIRSLLDLFPRLPRVEESSFEVEDISPSALLSKALQKQQLAPGLTAVGRQGKAPATNRTSEQLLQAAANNESGVRRVSVTEPSGRTVEVEGSTPVDIAAALEGRTELRPMRELTGTESQALKFFGLDPRSAVVSPQTRVPKAAADTTLRAAPSEPEQERGGLLGILERAGEFAGTPRGQILLGSIAEAIGGESVGGALGTVARQLGEGRAAQEVTGATAEGTPAPASQAALSPALQQQAIRSGLALREAKTQEERAKVMNELNQAQTAATASVEEQRENALLMEETRQNNQLELQKAEEASRIAVGQALDNRWMNVGEGFVLNWKTGEVRRIYDAAQFKGSSRIGNINSADYKQMLEFTANNFLPKVWEKYKEEMKALGFDSLVDIQRAFTDPESGTVNPGLVLARLDDKDKREFSDILMKFTLGDLQGVPRTATLSQIIAEGSNFVRPGDVRNGMRYIGPAAQFGTAETSKKENWVKVE